MKCTLSWLRQFTSTGDLTPAQIADHLTMLGLEVDSVEELYPHLDAIITAKVESVVRHPDSTHLSVCQVSTGAASIQVVCGAPNVHAGMIAALARPGTVLPDGTRLKKSKIRGVESCGMLCSARELALSTDHDGIMDLDSSLPAGLSLRRALHLEDAVIDVDLTPNRADCASVRGIAREIAGLTGSELKPLVDAVTPLTGKDAGFTVNIEEPRLCRRYAARKLTGCRVAPSPAWLQQRLTAVGIRPINNIVDITNYVMLESGQPLHAFDFARLEGGAIVVRKPRPGEETLVTLDGTTRKLTADTLLICDAKKPVALAGVMGGQNSEITDQTTTLLLESACFDPVSIRRTARRLGLPSEASFRFERGVDPDLADKALQRAVTLMAEVTGAVPEPDGIDEYPGKKPLIQLVLRSSRLNTLLGRAVPEDEVMRRLQSIGFTVTRQAAGQFSVTVPSFRMDIEREVDLIEEVARMIGYDSIPATQPLLRLDSPAEDFMRVLRREIGHNLTSQGFYEAINYSFVSPAHPDMLGLGPEDARRRMVRLRNPLSEEQSVLRTQLLAGLLENIERNSNVQNPDIRLYEIGKVFCAREAGVQPEERMQLCAVLSGQRYPHAEPLYFSGQQADFADLKGVAVQLLRRLGYPLAHGAKESIAFVAEAVASEPYIESGACMCLRFDGKLLGYLGAVRETVLQAFDLRQPVYFLSLDLKVLAQVPKKGKQFIPLARFPATSRDISLVVPEHFAAGELVDAVLAQKQKYVESVRLFDIYRGKPLAPGEKSVSLSITYRSADSTLDSAAADKVHNKIVQALIRHFDAHLREGATV